MEQITKAELVEGIEQGLIDQYFGTFVVNSETRAFYRSYKGASSEPHGFKLVYIVV